MSYFNPHVSCDVSYALGATTHGRPPAPTLRQPVPVWFDNVRTGRFRARGRLPYTHTHTHTHMHTYACTDCIILFCASRAHYVHAVKRTPLRPLSLARLQRVVDESNDSDAWLCKTFVFVVLPAHQQGVILKQEKGHPNRGVRAWQKIGIKPKPTRFPTWCWSISAVRIACCRWCIRNAQVCLSMMAGSSAMQTRRSTCRLETSAVFFVLSNTNQ